MRRKGGQPLQQSKKGQTRKQRGANNQISGIGGSKFAAAAATAIGTAAIVWATVLAPPALKLDTAMLQMLVEQGQAAYNLSQGGGVVPVHRLQWDQITPVQALTENVRVPVILCV